MFRGEELLTWLGVDLSWICPRDLFSFDNDLGWLRDAIVVVRGADVFGWVISANILIVQEVGKPRCWRLKET